MRKKREYFFLAGGSVGDAGLDRGGFRAGAVRALSADEAEEGETASQNETLMSPEIAVGWGMSFIPMEFSQS